MASSALGSVGSSARIRAYVGEASLAGSFHSSSAASDQSAPSRPRTSRSASPWRDSALASAAVSPELRARASSERSAATCVGSSVTIDSSRAVARGVSCPTLVNIEAAANPRDRATSGDCACSIRLSR